MWNIGAGGKLGGGTKSLGPRAKWYPGIINGGLPTFPSKFDEPQLNVPMHKYVLQNKQLLIKLATLPPNASF